MHARTSSAPGGPGISPRWTSSSKTCVGTSARLATHTVSPGVLALVRFGLRVTDDPRVRDTMKIVDGMLKVETPSGAMWHRYNGDGYGEHDGGAPFDGTGVGRGWPLLIGERARYELAAGRAEGAQRFMGTLESFATEGGLIPEQVWDGFDLREHDLHFGHPSGSAMPLLWAHAEYLKLRCSLSDGRVFDLPPQTVRRYLAERTASTRVVWGFNDKIRSMPSGSTLRIEALFPAIIHWTGDDWTTVRDTSTRDIGLGIHVTDLATDGLPTGGRVRFTFYWPHVDRWEGTDFVVRVGPVRRDEPEPGGVLGISEMPRDRENLP
jgi:glucoamylase